MNTVHRITCDKETKRILYCLLVDTQAVVIIGGHNYYCVSAVHDCAATDYAAKGVSLFLAKTGFNPSSRNRICVQPRLLVGNICCTVVLLLVG